MVIISNMDTQHNIIYHLNLTMSCQQMEKSAIYSQRLQPQQQGRFLPQIPYF